ncbi:hypothetical protein C8R44DRAFT_762351, partial [Mycena epipterygia]
MQKSKVRKKGGDPMVLLCARDAFLLHRASRSRFTGTQGMPSSIRAAEAETIRLVYLFQT